MNERALAFALMEQHGHYGIDDRWSVAKNRESGEWCLYYGGKHVDAWRMEAKGQGDLDGLGGFNSVEAVLLEFHRITESQPDWLKFAKRSIDSAYAALPLEKPSR